jgi:hypothetical protein
MQCDDLQSPSTSEKRLNTKLGRRKRVIRFPEIPFILILPSHMSSGVDHENPRRRNDAHCGRLCGMAARRNHGRSGFFGRLNLTISR